MSDVNELARQYVTESSCSDNLLDKNDCDNLHEIETLEFKAFIAGYQKARENLLNQAMEGYEEWIHQQGGPTLTFGSCWHQAGLSSLKEIEKLKSQLTEKEALLVEAVEVIGFYGNEKNWNGYNMYQWSSSPPSIRNDSYTEFDTGNDSNIIGGKKAREFLAKLKAGEE